jgi:transcriptional regulator with XRE-family HTH domain
MNQLSKNIKLLMSRHDINASQLARQTGLSPACIGSILNDRVNPRITSIEPIASYFSLSVADIMSEIQNKESIRSNRGDQKPSSENNTSINQKEGLHFDDLREFLPQDPFESEKDVVDSGKDSCKHLLEIKYWCIRSVSKCTSTYLSNCRLLSQHLNTQSTSNAEHNYIYKYISRTEYHRAELFADLKIARELFNRNIVQLIKNFMECDLYMGKSREHNLSKLKIAYSLFDKIIKGMLAELI